MAGGNKMPDLKIAFDQQVFLLQEYGGISRYLCCLAERLTAMPGVEARIFAPLHFNRSLGALPRMPGRGILLPKVPTKLFRLVAAVSTEAARMQIRKFRPDVIHETYFTFDNFLPSGAKRVVTVYDMIFERFASTMEHGNRTAAPKHAAVMRADHVICISENTQRDLIEFTGIPKDKTSVVHLAADDVFSQSNGNKDTPGIPECPYLLFVGSRQGYKNFTAFLRAFAASDYLRENFAIVCFGGSDFTEDELSLSKNLTFRPGQILHRSGDDSVLAGFYRKAAALVYPSLYEGFGIPPLEAMACCCPVICSKTSSLPEVVGNAAQFFDPEKQDDITEVIEGVLKSSERRSWLITQGRAQCAKFSWEKCAAKTMEIYKNLL